MLKPSITPKSALFLAAGMLTLAGCSSLPEPLIETSKTTAGPFVSGGNAAFTPEAAPDQWWRLYQDPTLDALIERALTANTDLRIASANLRRVRASLNEARSARLPGTTLSASGTYGRDAATMTPGATGQLDETDTYDAGLDVSYEIDLFGRVRKAIAAARADTQAARAALDVVRVSVAAETARAYADACSGNAQIAVAERTIDLQSQTVKLTQTLFDAGRGQKLDLAGARAELESSRADLPPLRAARDEALFRLATLTGHTPAEASIEARACTVTPHLDQPIPIGDGARLLKRRPDVRQAERQLAAATARIGVATADFYPTITLGGSAGVIGTDTRQLETDGAFRFSVGPLISWSFPNVFAARARVAAAKAGAEGAVAQFDKVVLTALQETETALSSYSNELDRNAALKLARDSSAEAARLAQMRFDAGADSFLTVLIAQRTLATAESKLALSDAALSANQITVFKALGGGWETTQTP